MRILSDPDPKPCLFLVIYVVLRCQEVIRIVSAEDASIQLMATDDDVELVTRVQNNTTKDAFALTQLVPPPSRIFYAASSTASVAAAPVQSFGMSHEQPTAETAAVFASNPDVDTIVYFEEERYDSSDEEEEEDEDENFSHQDLVQEIPFNEQQVAIYHEMAPVIKEMPPPPPQQEPILPFLMSKVESLAEDRPNVVQSRFDSTEAGTESSRGYFMLIFKNFMFLFPEI